ncbi:hypothetical protein HZB90_01050, partial [archaeon]|nr:hypothetical protein [archaeon]
MRITTLLLVLLLVVPLAFAAEPDDSYSNASWIPTNGTWENHTFEYAGDTDFVKFNATSGSFYLIRTVNISEANITGTKLFLYHTDGSTPLSADDSDFIGERFSARIVWRAGSTGTYYVQVNESNNTAGGQYNISVEMQGTLNPYLVSPSSWTNVT